MMSDLILLRAGELRTWAKLSENGHKQMHRLANVLVEAGKMPRRLLAQEHPGVVDAGFALVDAFRRHDHDLILETISGADVKWGQDPDEVVRSIHGFADDTAPLAVIGTHFLSSSVGRKYTHAVSLQPGQAVSFNMSDPSLGLKLFG